jgi:hypothetical protein
MQLTKDQQIKLNAQARAVWEVYRRLQKVYLFRKYPLAELQFLNQELKKITTALDDFLSSIPEDFTRGNSNSTEERK